jgi:hypothetical protein
MKLALEHRAADLPHDPQPFATPYLGYPEPINQLTE